jgi:hypothetical protein
MIRLITKLLIPSLLSTVAIFSYAESYKNSFDSATSGKPNQSVITNTGKPWQFLQPYQAIYDVNSDGEKLGQSTREMIFDNGHWTLKSSTKIKKWMLSLKSSEYSNFNIESNRLLPQEFYTNTKITFKKPREMSQIFNWENQLEKGQRGESTWELPLKKKVFDRMSHILALRKDLIKGKNKFNYLVSYKGQRKNYQYTAKGSETLKTSLGELDVIRMDRNKDNGDRFSIWLCPKFNYLPVKIAQFEKDKDDVVLTINKLEMEPIENKSVKTVTKVSLK